MPKGKPLTAAVRKTICDAIVAGNTRGTAAELAGRSRRWLFDKLAHDPAFAAAVEQADAEAEAAHVKVIQTAARKGNVVASIYWLKTRRAQEWGERQQQDVKVSGEVGLRIIIGEA